jgi:hypothetical protein
MSLKLYRSTVEDKVERIKSEYGIDSHEAFLRLMFSLVTGLGYDDLEPEDIIDGHGEYQIDVLHIDTSRRENYAVVTLLQVTFSESLSSTKLIKMHAGLDYLLVQPKSLYSAVSNAALRDKIQEFRDLRAEILPVNIRLQCYYATLGDPEKAVGEFPEQINRIKSDYEASTGEFEFDIYGPSQIFKLLNLRERRGSKANDRIKILYDQNKANLLEHSIEGVSGVICTVEANEIARIVNEHPTVFDDNLRRFFGFGGAVNEAIHDSCTMESEAPLFWFLNNGITIVCDDYNINKDFDKPFIDVESIRIVNGCQTSTILAKSREENRLQPSTKVLVRIFKTKSSSLATKLLVTTNTQNKITSRDLHTQDQIQADIQREFERRFHIKYERTPNEFSGSSKDLRIEIVSNEKIGQAFLGLVRKRPSDASRRQYKIWGEQYNNIFNSNVYPETYLLAYRVAEYSKSWKRKLLPNLPVAETKRTIVANGTYHIARAAAFLWRQGDDWNELDQVRRDLQRLQDQPELLEPYFEEALKMMVEIFDENEAFKQDPSIALKSGRLDEEIDKALYSKLSRPNNRKRMNK